MDATFTNLILTILAFLTGAISANLYSRIVATDTDEALKEAGRVIVGLAAENERLRGEALAQREHNARIQAKLEAELEELRRGLDALGKVRLGGVGE